MTIEQLKVDIAKAEVEMKAQAGHMVHSSDQGPIGMNWIRKVVTVLEDQEKRIAALEKK